jgi:hypothetical protein
MAMSEKIKTRRVVILIICTVIFIRAFFWSLYAFQNDLLQRTSGNTFGVDQKVPNRMEVQILFLSADLNKDDLFVRITPKPHGTFAIQESDGSESDEMSTDLTFNISVEGGKGTIPLKKNNPAPSIDGTLTVFDGRTSDYPFDKHRAELYAYFVNPKTGQRDIPIEVVFSGTLAGYNIDTQAIQGYDSPNKVGVNISISRTIVTKAFSMFILTLMWVVSLIVLFIALSVLFQNRPIETTLFSFMGTIIFALPAIRNLQPGIPPVGTLTDFLSFFWAEILVVISVGIMFYCWQTRYKSKSQES